MNALITPVLAAGIMDLEPGLTLWTAITFLVLVFVLARFAWKPILRTLDQRERTIREAVEQARKGRAEAERMLAEQTTSLVAAQREAAALAARSRQEAETLRQELTQRARKEAEEIVSASRRQIVDEKAKAIAELRGEVADLVVSATRKLVKLSMDEVSQRRLVEEYIERLPS